jgi:hypothetical protein
MKEHLLKMHTQAAKFHIGQAKCHKRLAALHETAAKETYKSAGQIVSDCHKSLAGEHEDCAEEHTAQAEFHIGMAKGLDGISTHDDSSGIDPLRRGAASSEKFGMFAMRDFSKVEPTRVHLALPDTPSSGRLIARPGGPQVNEEEDPTAVLDSFAHSSDEIKKAVLG